MSRAQEFWNGVKAELPLLLGVFPFGMIYGVLAMSNGLARGAAQSMSFIVFAGSSQFVTAQLVGVAAPGLIIVLTIFVVNLRHALYSAYLAPHLKHLPPQWKILLAYLLTDEAYAVTAIHYEKDGDATFRHYYFLGAGFTLWFAWQLSSAVGIFLGVLLPESWPLEFALPLTFIAMVVPVLKTRASASAALSAGVVAVAAFALPYKLAIIVAALVGISVGMLLDNARTLPVRNGAGE